MADGCVYASSEAVSVEQREFSSEQDIPDPATYVSSLNTDELKAELIKRRFKRRVKKKRIDRSTTSRHSVPRPWRRAD